MRMEHHIDGQILLGATGGLWLMQKMFWMANAFSIANLASAATVLSGLCAASFYIYSIYKKSKEK